MFGTWFCSKPAAATTALLVFLCGGAAIPLYAQTPVSAPTTVEPSGSLPATAVSSPALISAMPSDLAALPIPRVGPGLLARSIKNPEPPAEAWTRKQFTIPTVETPPAIDGMIQEGCWEKAMRGSGFYRFGSSAPVVEQTEVWICADKDNLYVAFHCLDSHPEKIRVSETQRGGDIEGDDHVAVLIDSQNTRRQSSMFFVSARGTQMEYLEGGTAGNITWAGDWKAATRRIDDGWTAELAIPFRLLRYPRGAKAFGLLMYRFLARETNPECWPYIPSEGQSWNTRMQYLHDFTGIAPPFYAPRPTFLPYLLATAGDASLARQGMDIKYPLSTTLTGLATLFPDFRTIEQDVTGISFSYNEQFVADRRPFFAEGSEFLPGPELFYSRRVDTVDEGLKVVGKSGNNTIGLVTAINRQPGKQRSSFALNMARDIGLLSRVGVSLAGDNRTTSVEDARRPSNRVGRVSGQYGWRNGKNQFVMNGNLTQSWQGNRAKGGIQDMSLRLQNLPGKPGARLSYNSIAPDFVNDLGLVPERNRRGVSASFFQFNSFDRGSIELYDIDSDIVYYDRHDGTFFRRSYSAGSYVQTRRGFGVFVGFSREDRVQDRESGMFADNNLETGFYWNQRTLFQGGGISVSKGRQAGERSEYTDIHQGFLISRPFSVRVSAGRNVFGEETTTQIIATGTYRLSDTQTISGRLIRQDGENANAAQSIGVVRGTNLYLAFSQRVRRGSDLFILLGDPNSANTAGRVTVKILRPY